MTVYLRCLLACVLGAAVTQAHAAGRYDRVPVRTAAQPQDRAFVRTLRELQEAVRRRDRVAVYGLLAPRFAVERDFGGMADPKLPARKQFDLVLPGWEALERLSAARAWGPWTPKSRTMCGPAPLTAGDLARIERAAKQRGEDPGDIWFQWIYFESSGFVARDKPSEQAPAAMIMSREAIRALDRDNGWFRVALPTGDDAYVRESDAVSIVNDRLCFRLVKGKWRLAAYVGGGD
jgi:hypothetical protein